jgi:hypothetical protein
VDKRLARRERWEALFPPWALALSGAALSVAYLFQHSLIARVSMFACFLGAAWLSGKKISPIATIITSAGIVAANLLVPVGRVMTRLGPFAITEGALLEGIQKALVFEGLLYVSKASILSSLRLPGRFGALVAASFVYYDRIVEYKGRVKPATLIEDADRLMLELWEEAESRPLGLDRGAELAPESRPARRFGFAMAALVASVIAAYAALALSLFRR